MYAGACWKLGRYVLYNMAVSLCGWFLEREGIGTPMKCGLALTRVGARVG